MKIDKQIKGERFRFYVNLVANEMTAKVRWFLSDEPVIGTLTPDFKHIILPDDFLSSYIHGVGRVPVGKLKLNKVQQREAKEYNEQKESANIVIEDHSIETGMGHSRDRLYYMSQEEHDNFNEIGYSGKLNGVKTSRQDYLNSLGKGTFKVTQTKFDNGDFVERFTIIRSYVKK